MTKQLKINQRNKLNEMQLETNGKPFTKLGTETVLFCYQQYCKDILDYIKNAKLMESLCFFDLKFIILEMYFVKPRNKKMITFIMKHNRVNMAGEVRNE